MQKIFVFYENNLTNYQTIKLEDIIKFIKGKNPRDEIRNLLPYINIEGMETNKFVLRCSEAMILVNSDDLLIVMDGASSGKTYSGYQGILGSTLAKIEVNQSNIVNVIEQKLVQLSSKIKELNTGSAIPHANKEYINSIELKINNETINSFNKKLQILKNQIFQLTKENITLNKLKSLYLKKFFG